MERGIPLLSHRIGLPAFGAVAGGVAALLAALAVAERAGMPGTLSWTFGFMALAIALAGSVVSARVAEEPLFLGRAQLMRPAGGGLVLGLLTGAVVYHLLGPASSRAMMAVLVGGLFGLIVAHAIARARRGVGLLIGEAGGDAAGAPSLIQGLLIAGAGGLIIMVVLPAATDGVVRLTGWGQTGALGLALSVPALALAVGGLRGLLALAAGFGLLIGAGILASLWLGMSQLGSLPLPGFSEADTLMAIAGARARLFPSDQLPFIVAWMPPEGVAGILMSGECLAAAVVTALVGRAASPGLPLERGGTVLAAAAGFAGLLLGLAAMAGFAVEAAGLQFVGASLQAPPQGLLESSRQGLAEFCGARPDTLDQLRAACGLTPRAQGQLGLERIRLTDAFLWTGVPVALGLPSAVAAPARLGPVAFPLLGVVAGLWLVALGLGRGVLGRGRIAPGLASHRLGLMRLAGFLGMGAIAGAWLVGTMPAVSWPMVAVLALLALGLDLVQQGLRRFDGMPVQAAAVQRPATSRRSVAPRKTAQSA